MGMIRMGLRRKDEGGVTGEGMIGRQKADKTMISRLLNGGWEKCS